MGLEKDYEDIPGTYVFNGKRCREGYHLNKFCKSLDVLANRETFKLDESAYLDHYPMTAEQRSMVEKRDWLGMLQVGGNIYYTFKLATLDGLNMQDVGGAMSHVTVDEFRQMLLDGGRQLKNNRSKAENNR